MQKKVQSPSAIFRAKTWRNESKKNCNIFVAGNPMSSPKTLYYTGGVETSTEITRIEVWQPTNNTWNFKPHNSPNLDRNNFAFVSASQN